MPAATLARLVLIEARRGGLPWLALASIVVGAALAGFLSEVALTETGALRISIVAAILRASAVFLIASHVASSTLRELNDKGLELLLALPLSRAGQYCGRLAGYMGCGFGLGLLFGAAVALLAPAAAAAAWGFSLACETALVAVIALFFASTLAQLVPAIAATLALYVLARSMAAIQLIASGPLAEPSAAGQAARWSIDAIALLLPRFDSVTQTAWLLYGPPSPSAYALALGGLALYAVLVLAAGLFDFQRRSV
jgi:ABC-type Na+ efflux pump permease subunit